MPLHRRECLPIQWIKSILEYDPLTGIFRWRRRQDAAERWNTKHAGKVAGFPARGYVVIQITHGKRTNYSAHVLAWVIEKGEWPIAEIDHIDRNRSNNAISNLRLSVEGGNHFNKSRSKRNTSGHVGVSYHRESNKWRARIYVNRKRVWDRLFDTALEAAEARRIALPQFHGKFSAT